MISSVKDIAKLLEYINHNALSTDYGYTRFCGVSTPREFITSLLTPDMEFKVIFILNNVPRNLHYTYIERFRQRYVNSACESLVPDLIRYICTVIHPGNAVLRSGTVQRWQFVRTLLASLNVNRSDQKTANIQHSKLALFYDWIFFNPKSDSFMCIGFPN
jgi:integrator complex subunit 3